MRSLLAIVAFVVAVCVHATAVAADAPVFAFGGKPLTLTCAQLANGQPLEVTNQTAIPQPLHVGLSPSAGDFSAACGGLTPRATPGKVPPGDAGTVTLKGKPNNDVAVEVSGAIVAYADGGLVASLPITIAPAGTEGSATPMVSSVSGTKYRQRSGPAIWIPVDLGEKVTTGFADGAVVGAVTGDDDRAVLTYADVKKLGDRYMVGINVEGLAAGKYTGKVDLLPGDEKGDVSVSLVVKDSWPVVVAVLLLSIALAFIVQRATGVRGPSLKLQAEADKIAQTYDDAIAALEPQRHGKTWRNSTLSDVAARIDTLKKHIKAKTAGAYISLDSKVSEALLAEITSVDDAVARLSELADSAPALTAVLATFDDSVPGPLPVLDPPPSSGGVMLQRPALVEHARKQLDRHDVAIEALPGMLSAVVSAQADVISVADRRSTVSELYGHALALEPHLTDPAARAKLHAVKLALAAVWLKIFEAPDSGIVNGRYQNELEGIRDVLGSIRVEGVRDIRTRVEDDGVRILALDATDSAGSHDESTPDPIRDLAADGVRSAELARWLELVSLAIGLILAVVAGMKALYVGEPFGTAWDYVTLATWGLATPTALALAGTALNNIGALSALARRLRR